MLSSRRRPRRKDGGTTHLLANLQSVCGCANLVGELDKASFENLELFLGESTFAAIAVDSVQFVVEPGHRLSIEVVSDNF